MNVLLVDADEIVDGDVVLRGRRAEHCIDILKVTPGSTVRAGITGGVRAIGTVRSVAGREVVVAIAPNEDGVADAPSPWRLVLAMPRPRAFARVMQTVATFAVESVDLINAWRVEKSYFGSPVLQPRKIGEELRLGAEQGETTWLPKVAIHDRFNAFMEMQSAPAVGPRLVLDARGGLPIEEAITHGSREVITVAVGPEGGWIDREVDSFVGNGYLRVSLGGPILRVESAVTAALAQLMLIARLPSRK